MIDDKIKCSFCGNDISDVDRLISSKDIYICEHCIKLCNNILNSDKFTRYNTKGIKDFELLRPKEIYNELNEFIIGQEEAKKSLSVAVYNHYKRILNPSSEIKVKKSNILMIGPTGSGKTYLAETLAKILDVPFAMTEAVSITEAGYVGDDVENILLRLIQEADYDISKAEKGIIYIDEIDKIARKSENRSITRDVSGEGVQQSLLKIIEGTIANVPPKGGRKHPAQDMIQMDTSDILFICGGAFDGIEKIIENRLEKSSVGFNRKEIEDDNHYKKITYDDVTKYGIIPELLGRLPVLVSLEKLTEDQLKDILLKPKNCLYNQYKYMFSLDGMDLNIHNDVINEIVTEAHSKNTGARGLRNVMEKLLLDKTFNIDEANVVNCDVTLEDYNQIYLT